MPGTLQDLLKTVIRFPISGPSPFNRLVHIRCVGAANIPSAQGETTRSTIALPSLFQIAHFDQGCAAFYAENTPFSVTAFASQFQNDAESAFTLSVDAVRGFVDAYGNYGVALDVAVRREVAAMFSEWIGVSVSTYLLCYEGDLDQDCKPA